MASVRKLASLFVRLDRGAELPLQQQIYDSLRQAVTDGRLRPATRLPSTRTLAAQLAVSRTTVVGALEQLIGEGYLEARARSGVFVASGWAAPRPGEVSRPAAASAARSMTLRLSSRALDLARDGAALLPASSRPRAFRLSVPALDAFPVRAWSEVLSRRAARASMAQLDYGQESAQLRAAIAELVSSSRGMRVTPEQVFLFSGSQGALEFAATMVLDPGDRVWMEDPGYPGARAVLGSAGAVLASVPVDDEGLVVAHGAAVAGDARLVFTTPSSQYPLGVTMSLARRRELLAWAARADAFIVEDDYQCEFHRTGSPQAALAALDDARVLYVNSFSWTMFPAIRLGYLIAPRALVEPLRRARAALEDPLPTLVQLAMADFITEGHFVRHLRRMSLVYRKRLAALVAAAQHALPAMALDPGDAGLQVVADLPAGVDARQVAAAALRRGIEAVPLARFFVEQPCTRNALLLGFGAVPPDRAAEGIAELAAAIADAARSA